MSMINASFYGFSLVRLLFSCIRLFLWVFRALGCLISLWLSFRFLLLWLRACMVPRGYYYVRISLVCADVIICVTVMLISTVVTY